MKRYFSLTTSWLALFSIFVVQAQAQPGDGSSAGSLRAVHRIPGALPKMLTYNLPEDEADPHWAILEAMRASGPSIAMMQMSERVLSPKEAHGRPVLPLELINMVNDYFYNGLQSSDPREVNQQFVQAADERRVERLLAIAFHHFDQITYRSLEAGLMHAAMYHGNIEPVVTTVEGIERMVMDTLDDPRTWHLLPQGPVSTVRAILFLGLLKGGMATNVVSELVTYGRPGPSIYLMKHTPDWMTSINDHAISRLFMQRLYHAQDPSKSVAAPLILKELAKGYKAMGQEESTLWFASEFITKQLFLSQAPTTYDDFLKAAALKSYESDVLRQLFELGVTAHQLLGKPGWLTPLWMFVFLHRGWEGIAMLSRQPLSRCHLTPDAFDNGQWGVRPTAFKDGFRRYIQNLREYRDAREIYAHLATWIRVEAHVHFPFSTPSSPTFSPLLITFLLDPTHRNNDPRLRFARTFFKSHLTENPFLIDFDEKSLDYDPGSKKPVTALHFIRQITGAKAADVSELAIFMLQQRQVQEQRTTSRFRGLSLAHRPHWLKKSSNGK